MEEPMQQYIIRRLADYRRQHARIARETGVAQTSVSRMSRGDVSPTLDNAQPVYDWLKLQEMKEQVAAAETGRAVKSSGEAAA